MSVSLWVIITVWLILLLICCTFGVRIFLTYNTLRLSQKDRVYAYGEMRPLRQERTNTLRELIATHKGERSDQQKKLLTAIEPSLSRETANEKEAEITLINSLIPAAQELLTSYGTIRQEKNRTSYDKFVALTHELASKKRHYNMLTKQYNTRLSLFPWDLIRNMSSIKEEGMFKLTADESRWIPAETIR